ncbi:MAG: mitochondrial fission ELM1 family protein [Pseudomonadota bacterium]
MLSPEDYTCWIITEGMAGTENQCIGVACALGLEPEIKRVQLKEPWKTLSPYLGFEGPWCFTEPLEGPWPDILLVSGRKAIAAARYIKKASNGKNFTCFIQDPRVSPKNFDLVAVPEHDPTRGNNVITTLAAPNKITEDKLDDAREEFPQFEDFQTPRVAVMIGGNSKSHTLTKAVIERFCEQLKALDCGLMVSTSRRTGEENTQMLHEALKDSGAYIWDGKDPNPYIAMLAWAQFIIVTSDSTSMLSDAAATGKPVYMVELEGGGKRLDKMQQNLIKAGIVKVFNGKLESWRYEPLREAEYIAKAIVTKLK